MTSLVVFLDASPGQLDALHLAAAVEHGCTRFLSSDAQLKRFPDVLVEVLS
ncbi:MAG: hypothetical protein ACHRXM_35430 [Isosphaerales bacterium]